MAQTPIIIGFPGNPAADTVYTAFTLVNDNAVTIDAEQVVQDGLIADNAAQITVIDGQITGLGVGLNDVNAQVNINTIDIAANTVLINANLKMTYSVVKLGAPITNVPNTYRTLLNMTDGNVSAHDDYEYRLSTVIESDLADQLYYLRYRIDSGAWTELLLRTKIIGGDNVTALWISDSPLSNSSSFEVEVRKDATSVGNMTVSQGQIAIAQVY